MEKVKNSKNLKNPAEAQAAERGPGVSRRFFLKSAMLAAAAGSGGLAAARWSASAGAPAPEKKKVTVGGHLWVYAASQPGYDPTPVLEQVFADMSYAGLDGVELMHSALMHDDAVERIGGLSRQYKLPVIGTSFEGAMWNREAHPAILKEAELFLPRLAKLGGRTLGTSVGHAPQTKTPAQLEAQAEMVRQIAALAKTHGVVLNLHNHTYEVENNEYDLKGTLARVPEAQLGPDLNWLLRAGVDPVDFIKRYGQRIIFLHLRDQKADGTWPEAMGEGDMDYVAIGQALREIKFRGDATIELAHEQGFQLTRPLRESLKMSREFVRKTLGF
jgi:sugar phosphate isomerase/epimerase